MALLGEAGVGKSRLLREFLDAHRTPEWVVLRASAVSYGTATPFLPIAGLLEDYFRIDPHDDPPTMVEKVRSTLEPIDEAGFPGTSSRSRSARSSTSGSRTTCTPS